MNAKQHTPASAKARLAEIEKRLGRADVTQDEIAALTGEKIGLIAIARTKPDPIEVAARESGVLRSPETQIPLVIEECRILTDLIMEDTEKLKTLKSALEKLGSQHDAELLAMQQYFPGRAIHQHREELAAMEQSLVAGKGVSMFDGFTHEDIEQENRLKLSACKRAIKRFAKEAHELAAPHFAVIIESLGELIERRLESERAMSEMFHVPFEPSNVLLLFVRVRQVIREQKDNFNPDAGGSPRQVAAFII